MAGINPDYLDPVFLPFVFDKGVELRESPTMQFPLVLNVLVLFTTPDLGRFTDVGEVFQDNRCPSWGVLDDAFTQDVVTIAVESLLLFAHLFQVTFGRLRSVRLELATETEGTAIYPFPVRRA